jgi:hypothetical protein
VPNRWVTLLAPAVLGIHAALIPGSQDRYLFIVSGDAVVCRIYDQLHAEVYFCFSVDFFRSVTVKLRVLWSAHASLVLCVNSAFRHCYIYLVSTKANVVAITNQDSYGCRLAPLLTTSTVHVRCHDPHVAVTNSLPTTHYMRTQCIARHLMAFNKCSPHALNARYPCSCAGRGGTPQTQWRPYRPWANTP